MSTPLNGPLSCSACDPLRLVPELFQFFGNLLCAGACRAIDQHNNMMGLAPCADLANGRQLPWRVRDARLATSAVHFLVAGNYKFNRLHRASFVTRAGSRCSRQAPHESTPNLGLFAHLTRRARSQALAASTTPTNTSIAMSTVSACCCWKRLSEKYSI